MKLKIRYHTFLVGIIIVIFFFFTYGYHISSNERITPYTLHGYTLLFLLFVYFRVMMYSKYKSSIIRYWGSGIIIFIIFMISRLSIAGLHENISAGIVVPTSQLMFLFLFIDIVNCFKYNRREVIRLYCNFIIVFSTVSLIFAIYGFFVGSFSLGIIRYTELADSSLRLSGWYGSPNSLGPVLAVGIFCIIFVLLNKQNYSLTRKKRFLLYNLLILNFMGLLFTGSLGTLISLILGLSVFIGNKLWNLKKYSSQALLSVLTIFILISLTIPLLSLMGYDYSVIIQEYFRADRLDDVESVGRYYYWASSIQIFQQASISEMLLGHGPGYLGEYFGRSAHSGYLNIMINYGLVNLLILIILIYKIIKKCLKTNDQYELGSFILGILTFMTFKNITNNEIPSNGFIGILFIWTIVVIYHRHVIQK